MIRGVCEAGVDFFSGYSDKNCSIIKQFSSVDATLRTFGFIPAESANEEHIPPYRKHYHTSKDEEGDKIPYLNIFLFLSPFFR